MAPPILERLLPAVGPTSGGDVVRLIGTGFGNALGVLFDEAVGQPLSRYSEGARDVLDVRTPPHPEGVVDVTLASRTPDGEFVSADTLRVPDAYRYARPSLTEQSDLTRLVRTLLRTITRDVLASTSMTVSIDYGAHEVDGVEVVPLASLPCIVLSGPRMTENRFFSTHVLSASPMPGAQDDARVRRRSPYTVDLAFTLTVASERTVELLNLMKSVGTFLHRTRWISMLRDPRRPSLGEVRWEMDPEGSFRPQFEGPGDVRVFSCGVVVRGFDLDEGLPLEGIQDVDAIEVLTQPRRERP